MVESSDDNMEEMTPLMGAMAITFLQVNHMVMMGYGVHSSVSGRIRARIPVPGPRPGTEYLVWIWIFTSR